MSWLKSFVKYLLVCICALLGIVGFLGAMVGIALLIISLAKTIGWILSFSFFVILFIIVACAVAATSDWLSERYRK